MATLTKVKLQHLLPHDADRARRVFTTQRGSLISSTSSKKSAWMNFMMNAPQQIEFSSQKGLREGVEDEWKSKVMAAKVGGSLSKS